MSRIFRSDAVAVGDRVVVRQRRGEHASDIIGHVVSLDPLVIRPQEVGGFPSSKEAIEVTDLHIIKKLSPRTVRNSEIRALEQRLAERLTDARRSGALGFLRPDGKTQVTISYDGDKAVALDTLVPDSANLAYDMNDVIAHIVDDAGHSAFEKGIVHHLVEATDGFRDTGIGMSEDEMSEAMIPYSQVSSIARERGDGTGLGLPLTKAMVEANSARFTLRSTQGEGTIVEITFPADRVVAQ